MGEAERDSGADSLWSAEPDVGLDPTILRSPRESKLRVGCFTEPPRHPKICHFKMFNSVAFFFYTHPVMQPSLLSNSGTF